MTSLWIASSLALATVLILGCGTTDPPNTMDQSTLNNQTMRERAMLPDMYIDDFFPDQVSGCL